jgi:hypothetical protein
LQQLHPLFKSYQHLVVIPSDEQVKSLAALLNSADGFQSFQQFLRLEFSVENIFFWQEVCFLLFVSQCVLCIDIDISISISGQ